MPSGCTDPVFAPPPSQHFVDLPTVVLTSNLPSLYNLKTLRAFPFTKNTTRFVCTGLPKLEDSSIAYALKRMPGLEAVDLRCVPFSSFSPRRRGLALMS